MAQGISAAEMARRLRNITQSQLQEVVQETILNNQETLSREKENELIRGERPDRSNIGRYTSPYYARLKSSLNPVAGYGNVDLIKSGVFAASLTVKKTSGNAYTFQSDIGYGKYIIWRYGADILGLNQETFNRLQETLFKPDIIRYIKTKIGQ